MSLTNEDISKLRTMMGATPMTPVEHAKWCISGSNSDSDSDHQDPTRLPYRTTIYGRAGPGMTNIIPGILENLDIVPKLLEKIKLERQSAADLPESEPKPEPCDVVQPAEVAEQAAKQACFPVPPPAPRHRRRQRAAPQ